MQNFLIVDGEEIFRKLPYMSFLILIKSYLSVDMIYFELLI